MASIVTGDQISLSENLVKLAFKASCTRKQ